MIELNQEKIREEGKRLLEEKLKPSAETKEALPQSESEKQIRQELERIHKENAPALSTPAAVQPDSLQGIVSQLLELDDREKLVELITIAFSKGPRVAVKIARGLNDPIVLDTFHDLLARDELFKKLEERNQL